MKIPHYLLLDIGSHLLVSPCEVIHVCQSYKGFLESCHMFGSPTVYKLIIISMSNVTCESWYQNIFILAWRIFTFISGSLSGWFVILCNMSMMSSLALTNFFLWKASNLVSFWNWNLYTQVGVQSSFFREIRYVQAWKLSNSPSLSPSWCDISYWNENLKWK